MLKCLWIARDIPFPQDAGDKIYSANLARSFAQTGLDLRFTGFGGEGVVAPKNWPLDWCAVPGKKRSNTAGLMSTLPIAAAIHATKEYHQLLDAQFREDWDIIVFDSYGSGWALHKYLGSLAKGRRKATLVHVSHNHEASLWRDMVRSATGNPLRRLALWQNYLKTRRLEHYLARNVDLISAITEEDACRFQAQAPHTPSISLTPGYSGWTAPERSIEAETPRRVIMVGSFRWVVKQENLRQFLDRADARLHANGIELDILGDVPEDLLAELRPKVRATRFHGFVDSVEPYFRDARLAIVPELIGGGFKLKFLDYIFGRVPVLTLDEAAAGLPESVRKHLIRSNSLDALTDDIIAHIDRIEHLNALQTHAYTAARASFHWKDRGSDLHFALVRAMGAIALQRGAQA